MEQQTHQSERVSHLRNGRGKRPGSSLRERAEQVCVSAAVLALIASVSDGEPDPREIECLVDRFKHRFALANRPARRMIAFALKQVRNENAGRAFDEACDTLREHLNVEQRLSLMEDLADIIVADDRIHELEECYLDLVAVQLGIVSPLNPES